MKYTDKCSICRRVGEKLFLKGEKCNLPSCPFLKRSYSPGESGPRKRGKKSSDYLIQLIEKQKARAIYGVSERQMTNYFVSARRDRGRTGAKLFELLEKRLDNIVFRAKIASSRKQARQLVTHGGIKINGKTVDIPSYQTGIDDKISASKPSDKKISQKDLPSWLKLTAESGVEVIGQPEKDSFSQFNEQLIIEYYSR
ncbi:MAG: 30S ribosomal protein S4 [Candidatus Berkelbacteria bacterium]|nr:30S ribosomal protein S4 [Candidatus Berkelbacteria bacterium]